MCNSAKVTLKGTLRAPNVYIRKEKWSKIKIEASPLEAKKKKKKNEGQSKSNTINRKQTINIRVKINEIENE